LDVTGGSEWLSIRCPTQGRLTFAPRINSDDFRGFFITGSNWGTFSQKDGAARLSVDYGSLSLNELRLKSSVAKAAMCLGEQTIAADVEQIDGYMRLRFAQPMTIAAGETLTVSFG